MTLPTPESLATSIANLERELALREAGFAATSFPATSPDGSVTVTAVGDVSLLSVVFTPAALALPAEALAAQVAVACSQALNLASASGAAAAFAAAGGYSLPGLPGPFLPPPSDRGFDAAVGSALAMAPAVEQRIQQALFEGTEGPVRAVVTGGLELRTLRLTPPLPAAAPLASNVVAAVNLALFRARNLFETTVSDVVNGVTDPTGQPVLPDLRPKALLVVENAATPRASDGALRARLAGLGFAVELRKAPAAVIADATGRSLIVISESVVPTDVGSKFVGASVPIIALEPQQFRDLKMTAGTSGTDFGESTNQTQLQITGSHPLAAGLTGTLAVAQAPSKFGWGKPSGSAIKVATIVGQSNRAAIFAYDTGDTMVGQAAPARRVGWFAGQDTAAQLNEQGWRLFDAAVRWATAARALLTVGTVSPLAAVDVFVKKRLEEQHGLEVLVRLATDTRTSDLGDVRMHILSDSIVNGTDVGGRFTNSPAPTLCFEAILFDDMKMTAGAEGTDFGTVENQTSLDIVTAGHPLAAALTGRVSVVAPAQKFGWGRPGPEAVKVASLAGVPDRQGIFGYESGANMVGARAPAPRVGFFAEGNSAATLTPEGVALFDAAVRWARKARALLVVGALPLSSQDEALRARLERLFGFVVDVRRGNEVLDKLAAGKRLIVVSGSAAEDVGSKLTNLAIPVLALQPALFDNLKLTAGTANSDFGEAANQTDIDLVKADHPLAAGLSTGRLKVLSTAAKVGWGKPAPAAVKIARVVGKTDQWAIFGYETGTTMTGINAPARRVGWFAGPAAFAALEPSGLRLFDAAVGWAAGRFEAFPDGGLPEVVRGGGTAAAPLWKVGVAYRIGDEVTFDGMVFRCRQAHTSQIDWQPPLVYALWERIDTSGVWTLQVVYAVGDEVMFAGQRWRCIQGHQAQPDREPPMVPTLWQRVA